MNVEGTVYRLLVSKKAQLSVFVAMYILLAVEYRRFVYTNYYYLMGFDYSVSPVAFMLGLGLVMLTVAVMFLVPREDDGSYVVAMMVALLFCLPSIVMFQFGGSSVFIPLYTMLFLILVRTPLIRVKRWRVPKMSPRWQRFVLPAVCLLCLLPFPLAYGLNIDFSLLGMGENTYDVRAEVSSRETVLTAYLMGPLRMVLLPMLIVYGMCNFKRDWWMTVAGVAGLLFLFLLNPQKSIFFSIAVVLAFYFFRSHYAKAGMVLFGLMAAAVLSVLLNVATGHLMAESIVVRRLFYIPVIVSDSYFTFFDANPMCLSHSFLKAFFDYPYQLEPSRLIGTMMYNRVSTNCNTGIVADGFMNFGHVGAVMFVACAGLFVRLVGAYLGNGRFFGLLALLVYCFLNSAFFTTLLTHGGLALLLAVVFLIPDERSDHDEGVVCTD